MNIILAKEEHLEQIYQVECAVFPHPWSKKSIWGDLVSPQTNCYGAEQDGKMVGYCSLSVIADEGTILHLAVLPEFRRQGIGRTLAAHAVFQAKLKGVSYVLLEVRVTNAPARRLYESLDFKKLEIRKRYYQDDGEDALVMIRRMES